MSAALWGIELSIRLSPAPPDFFTACHFPILALPSMRTLRRFSGPDRRVIYVVSGLRFVTFEISESVSDPATRIAW